MALYDLVSYRQTLTQALDVGSVVTQLVQLRDRIASIKVQIPVLSAEHQEKIDQLVAYYDNVLEQIQQPLLDYPVYLESINKEINATTHKLFSNNYDVERVCSSIDVARNVRRIHISEDVEQSVKQKILLYTSWRYPTLEIGCRDGEWTQYLVAGDPLYITDWYPEFIESASSRFTPEYQARLRKYPLNGSDLSALPRGQFSFVFSWGFFNYVSLDTMHQFLDQVYQVLRPGGVFMFSYNDGDTPAGAGLAENFSQTYMPKSLLLPLCESRGFDIVETVQHGANIFWLEIKKPGELQTTKAHQVLGEIKRRDL